MGAIAFIESMNAAIKITKALVGVRDAAMIEANIFELRDHLMTIQSSALQSQADQAALIQRVRDLEQEVVDLRTWETQKQRYQLVSPWAGCWLYALKDSSKGADPAHWICTHCYENGRREILQLVHERDRRIHTVAKCFHCSFQIEMHNSQIKPVYADSK